MMSYRTRVEPTVGPADRSADYDVVDKLNLRQMRGKMLELELDTNKIGSAHPLFGVQFIQAKLNSFRPGSNDLCYLMLELPSRYVLLRASLVLAASPIG